MPTPLALNIERYLDVVSARQKLVTSNIANAATPGYRTRDLDFQMEYHAAVEAGNAGTPDVIEPDELRARNDGNNVSLDRETKLLAENGIRFNFAAQLWKSQMRQVRAAIQEGRNG